MGKNIAIVKCGALGDVLRTTPLVRALEGNRLYWITAEASLPLVPLTSGCTGIEISSAAQELRGIPFDLVLSLDEEAEAARTASELQTKEFAGAYNPAGGTAGYTDSSAEWFDMSLISRYGRAKADELKKQNRRSYQEIVFGMAGLAFRGERYVLDAVPARRNAGRKKVGLETRAGSRWPSKRWDGYGRLAAALRDDGMEVEVFSQKRDLAGYIAEIASCSAVVTGDTLALHVAIALGIRCVAIFTCTSPSEIYGYGLVRRVVSPLLGLAFYRTEYVKEAVEAVSVEQVHAAVRDSLASGLEVPHG
jgi:heptosyltransferase II